MRPRTKFSLRIIFFNNCLPIKILSFRILLLKKVVALPVRNPGSAPVISILSNNKLKHTRYTWCKSTSVFQIDLPIDWSFRRQHQHYLQLVCDIAQNVGINLKDITKLYLFQLKYYLVIKFVDEIASHLCGPDSLLPSSGSRDPYDLFTVHGNGTGTGIGNGTSTIGNNGPWSLSPCHTDVDISTWHYTFHLIPVPVPFPFPCSMNIPLLLFYFIM